MNPTPADYQSVLERLGKAAELAAGNGPVNARLFAACLELVPLLPDEFPEATRDEFIAILRETTPVDGSEGEGDLSATISRMNETTAARYARRIVELHAKTKASV